MKGLITSKTRSAVSFMMNITKSIDMFAVPISLNFKGKNRFSTFIGGVATLAVIAWILYNVSNQITTLVDRKSSVVNSGCFLILILTLIFYKFLLIQQKLNMQFALWMQSMATPYSDLCLWASFKWDITQT